MFILLAQGADGGPHISSPAGSGDGGDDLMMMEVGDVFGGGESQGDDRETADDPEMLHSSSVRQELCDEFNSSATNLDAGSNGEL